MKKLLVLSDIHGNVSALDRILETEQSETFDGVVLLGDLIDYGPRSNEVIQKISQIPEEQLLVNLWGNHEQAVICHDYSRFSSDRGRRCAKYTRENLTSDSFDFLENKMNRNGKQEIGLSGKRCLAVHGSLADPYWKSISHEEAGMDYAAYDVVFSGHSHIPHYFEHFYPVDCEAYRNKKRTVFLNPGSVGQPRNHNPNAHYAIIDLDTMSVLMKCAEYDIEQEIRLFSNEVDSFYRERLKTGI